MDFRFENVENGKIITVKNGTSAKRYVYANEGNKTLTSLVADIMEASTAKGAKRVARKKKVTFDRKLAAKKAWETRRKNNKVKEKAA